MNRVKILLLVLISTSSVFSQLKDYEIHKRGMLWETIFNTGEIGRSYHQGQAGNNTSVPLMEWPGYSKSVIDQKEYDGKHNLLGGGIYLAGDPSDTTVRYYAMCGAVGSNAPELVAGKWSFPLLLYKKENFPLLANGSLNPNFNPDEAEEIIVSKWATPLGLTVTRTSRVWSYPDYDDFIIYEYEVENTGDRDGDPTTIESRADYKDLIVSFAYGFAPNMFAYLRQYNIWQYQDYERKDQRGRWDRDRWLNYNLDMDGKPDPQYYNIWGTTGKFGGGLNAPGAVGYAVLHYDTQHLATYNETVYRPSSSDSLLFWDLNTGKVKQPWVNYLETSNLRSSKVMPKLDVSKRYNTPYKNPVFGPNWIGRGSFNHRQTRKAVGRIMMLGPYTLKFGEKIKFAIAEVCGYGAATVEQTRAGLKDEGGSCGEDCGESSEQAFYPVPNWYERITYGGATGNAFTYGSTYLKNFQLPQFVNSNVVTIRDVTDKAKFCYTGDTTGIPYWPASFPNTGIYKIPIPVPAPIIEVISNPLAQNEIAWKNSVENFSVPRLQGTFNHYELYKSEHPLGPWTKLDSIVKNDSRYYSSGEYKYIDKNTRVGESFYYSVLSVDNHGNKSGRTNITLHQTQLGGTITLGKVYVVPNPFFVRSGFSGSSTSGDVKSKLGFYNLPKKCTIKIFSYSGQLVNTIEHETNLYSAAWYQITRNDQEIASGVYFYVVQTPDGNISKGKFVVIR
jgi:hypothetical protein